LSGATTIARGLAAVEITAASTEQQQQTGQYKEGAD